MSEHPTTRSPLAGSGQAYVPGGGHRTGPPGKHVIGGKAKFRVMDDKVRYYVGPGAEILDSTDVSQSLPESARGYLGMHDETDHSHPPFDLAVLAAQTLRRSIRGDARTTSIFEIEPSHLVRPQYLPSTHLDRSPKDEPTHADKTS